MHVIFFVLFTSQKLCFFLIFYLKSCCFTLKQIDSFVIEAVSLGTIKSAVIGHNEKRPGFGWHLEYLSVKEFDSNDEQVETYFPCDK